MIERPPVHLRRGARGEPWAQLRHGVDLALPGQRDSLLRRRLAVGDAVGVAIALAIAVWVAAPGDAADQLGVGLLTLPLWILLFKLYGLYDQDAKRVSHATVDDVPWLFHALVIGSLGLWFVLKVAADQRLVLSEGVLFFAAAFALVLFVRAAVRRVHSAGPPGRMLVVGGGPLARLLVRKIRAHPEYGLEPIGYLVDDVEQAESLDGDLPCLGEVADVARVCAKHAVSRVAVVGPAVEEASLTELIRRTKDLEVRMSVVPSAVDVLGPSVEIDDIEGLTVLGMNPPALPRSSRSLKRAMDLALAVPLLVVVAPLLAAATLAIRLGSPGPVLYSQSRVGRHGHQFRVHKFRTMVVDAEARVEELRALSAHPAWLALEEDPRVTRVGRVLRRTSIDELPQLWNVIRGDMSLVGPRPMPPDVQRLIEGWGARRLDLTPGITGPWQVLGRTKIPFEEMVKLDYLYVTNWSLWWDIRLLVRTLPAVLEARGAN